MCASEPFIPMKHENSKIRYGDGKKAAECAFSIWRSEENVHSNRLFTHIYDVLSVKLRWLLSKCIGLFTIIFWTSKLLLE